MALHHAPSCDLHINPSLLNSVGVFNAYAGMFERKLPDLFPGLFGAIEPFGGATDFVLGKGHMRSQKEGAEICLTC